MLTRKYANGAASHVVTDCFKREMTRPAGAPIKLHAATAQKYDGVGGYAKDSSHIPLGAWIGAGCFVAGVVISVRLLMATGFY